MDTFRHNGRQVTVVQRRRRKKPESAEEHESPVAKALNMQVIEETSWFSLDDLKKRRFEEPR